MNFDHLNGRILAAHNNPLNPTGIANYVFEQKPEGFHHPYIGSIYCIDDPEMDYIKRRMVACWNACEGLDTEYLERFGLGTALGSEIVALRAQCDEATTALNNILEYFRSGNSVAVQQATIRADSPEIVKAFEVLAKLKGGAA